MAALSPRDVRTTWVFSGKEEDWVCFAENFEAKMFVQKLNKVLNVTMTAQSQCRPEPATEQELNAATKLLEETKLEVWFELVYVLDNKTINSVRNLRGDGDAA